MMQKCDRLKILPGLSLIEVVVSLAILGLLALALISTSLISQKGARAAKADTQATKLVQEYSEQIRIFRDRNGFSSLTNGACKRLVTSVPDPKNWTLNNCPPGDVQTLDNVIFTRQLSIASMLPALNKKQITITVTWNGSGGTQKREHVLILSDCIQSNCP